MTRLLLTILILVSLLLSACTISEIVAPPASVAVPEPTAIPELTALDIADYIAANTWVEVIAWEQREYEEKIGTAFLWYLNSPDTLWEGVMEKDEAVNQFANALYHTIYWVGEQEEFTHAILVFVGYPPYDPDNLYIGGLVTVPIADFVAWGNTFGDTPIVAEDLLTFVGQYYENVASYGMVFKCLTVDCVLYKTPIEE